MGDSLCELSEKMQMLVGNGCEKIEKFIDNQLKFRDMMGFLKK